MIISQITRLYLESVKSQGAELQYTDYNASFWGAIRKL